MPLGMCLWVLVYFQSYILLVEHLILFIININTTEYNLYITVCFATVTLFHAFTLHTRQLQLSMKNFLSVPMFVPAHPEFGNTSCARERRGGERCLALPGVALGGGVRLHPLPQPTTLQAALASIQRCVAYTFYNCSKLKSQCLSYTQVRTDVLLQSMSWRPLTSGVPASYADSMLLGIKH